MKSTTLMLMATCFFLYSCEEESEPEPIIQNIIIDNPNREALTFNPPSAIWQSYDTPDSIIIEISGGIPPYHIKDYYYAPNSQIFSNRLILFPSFFSNANILEDINGYINIADNAENTTPLNITVQSPYKRMNSTQVFEVDLQDGSRSLYSSSTLKSKNSYFNKLSKSVNILATNDTVQLSVNVNNVTDPGTYFFNNLRFSQASNYSGPTVIANYNAAPSQVLNITTINDTTIKGNLNVIVSNSPTAPPIRLLSNFEISR